jgi:hypothetical protein
MQHDRVLRTDYPRVLEGVKVCGICGVIRDVSEFASNKMCKDGLGSECRICQSERAKSKKNSRKTEGTKICSKCKVEKSVDNFTSRKRNSDGLCPNCKECNRAYGLEIKQRSVLKIEGTKKCSQCGAVKSVDQFWKVATHLDGRSSWCIDCSRADRREFCAAHPDLVREQKAGYYQKYKDGHIAEYTELHKSEILERRRIYEAKRLSEDISYKLAVNLRKRLGDAIKQQYKSGSAIQDLGCSIPILKFFLENQFYMHPKTEEMMSWENYGRGKNKWQIDHIKELHTFDLTDRKQFLQACHVTNLQPIWWDENLKKSMKIRKKECK